MKDRCATQETILRSMPRRSKPRGLPDHGNTPTLHLIATAAFWLVAACGSDAPISSQPLTTPPVAGQSGLLNPGLPTAGTTSGPPVTPPPVGGASAAGGSSIGINTGGSGGAPAVAAPDILPCGVAKALATNCQTCHAATPIAGAPMPLVTFADLHKAAVTQPTMKVFQVVQLRIHDVMHPMPPQGKLPDADMTTLDTWTKAGGLTGTAADATCDLTPPQVIGKDGSAGPLTPGPGETCYEFKTHQSTTMVDDVKYDVGGTGEHYEQFYFKVPWPKDTVATGYATIIDNPKVLHHWLLFSTNETDNEGFHKTAPLPTLIGTNPILLAGWAVGAPNVVPPKDVGFELPDPGGTINVQWHFYNSTTEDQKDASKVQICTIPKAMRAHVGGVTWLGTEDLGGNKWFGGKGMPPHQMSTFKSTCTPGRTGLGPTDSIHIIGFEPHMHKIGKHMTTTVTHMDGTTETIFDQPFSFGNETHYFKDYELKAGEKLNTACSFDNESDVGVPFGESSDTEMCYQFTFAWPAHSMTNHAASLLGVPDTCW